MSRFLHLRYASLAPYTPGEQPQNKNFVKLNTNESPYPPSPLVAKAACEEAKRLHLYSDPTAKVVVEPLAEAMGVLPEEVIVGNGSDEILAWCFMAFCEKGAAFADITYGFYKVYAQLNGITPVILPLREDFTLGLEAYFHREETIFIANPNAPTGLCFGRADIEKIVERNPDTLVVIDEAYVDFGGETSVPLVHKYDNILVVGTFSKSRSLAGGRLGYAVGNHRLIADLGRLKYSINPYNVNRMTQAAGAACLQDVAYFEQCTSAIVNTREQAKQTLASLGFEMTDSMANFLFVRHPAVKAEELYLELREQGILVRWFNQPRISDYLRITVGTPGQMEGLYDALRYILPPEYAE